MSEKPIIIRGAYENNLKHVNLEIPKGRIVVFTGVSGSGKSSIVYDTIAVESQRQLNELYPTYIRSRMQRFERPKVEMINNLTPAVIINQKRFGGNSRSTVGTMTDIAPMLRLLFSRRAEPSAGLSPAYSFNDPSGMCPVCSGLGMKVLLDPDKLLDKSKSLQGGAILFDQFAVNTWQWQIYANSGFFDVDKKLCDYTTDEMHQLLCGTGPRVQVIWGEKIKEDRKGCQYEGLVDRFRRLWLNRDIETLSAKNESAIRGFVSELPCPACHGDRLNDAALDSKINGLNIADYCKLEIPELLAQLYTINDPIGKALASTVIAAVSRIEAMGLGYLHLNRETESLSGGESQRLKMVRHLGSSLSGMTYILDEPSAGLHPKDIKRLISLLIELRDKGNTVLVVEHDRDIIELADELVDIGPSAGTKGGSIVYQGSVEGILRTKTLTGIYLKKRLCVKESPRVPSGWFEIHNASTHNLKNLNVCIPLGVLCAVSGVAGSGKSSLVKNELCSKYPSAVLIDQSAVGASSRSNPATYVGIMDELRKLFAKENGVSASLFSFNSAGACPSCGGKGEIIPEMAFADPVAIRCEECSGGRYSKEALKHKLRGKSILELLEMTIDEALLFFIEKKIIVKLKLLSDVGLSYITLGQPTNELSGGECQRLKLANELEASGSLYILDEPTTGLHMADIEKLMMLLNGIVDKGNSVIVVEHNLDVISGCDWVLDLGPGGGKDGGELLFEGRVSDLLRSNRSFTAEFLRKALE